MYLVQGVPGWRGTWSGGGYLTWAGVPGLGDTWSGGVPSPGGHLVWGGVYLAHGGVPGPRGVYLVPGGVPGLGGVPGPGGLSARYTPRDQTRYTPTGPDQVHLPMWTDRCL